MKELINPLSEDTKSHKNHSGNFHTKSSNWFLLTGTFSMNNISTSP